MFIMMMMSVTMIMIKDHHGYTLNGDCDDNSPFNNDYSQWLLPWIIMIIYHGCPLAHSFLTKVNACLCVTNTHLHDRYHHHHIDDSHH